MGRTTALFVSLVLLPISAAAQSAPGAAADVVAAIQVHGNTLTSTEEVIRASGITVGDRVSEKMLADAETRLRVALKPDAVDVLKRYRSVVDVDIQVWDRPFDRWRRLNMVEKRKLWEFRDLAV